jgi:hypothetical protein
MKKANPVGLAQSSKDDGLDNLILNEDLSLVKR